MSDSQKLILNYNDIPAMPNIMVKALGVIKDENSGINDLVNIMCYDQALTTQILKLVNSAYYGFAQQITSIQKALPLLGMVQAKNIIITCAMKPMLTTKGGKDLWNHSIRAAVGCEFLAKEYKLIDPSEAFIIGFLHDIGKMILSSKNAMIYAKVIDLAKRGADIIEIENSFFGSNHADVGFLLAKKWQLPLLLINCIKYHHQPQSSSMSNFAYMVYIADKLTQTDDTPISLDPVIMKNSNLDIKDHMALRVAIIKKADILLSQLTM